MNKIILIAFAATHALAVHAQSASSFAITSSTIDAGGGTSRGGSFALSGTIGQPDTAPPLVSADGRFQLEPGFWSDVTLLPALGAPLMKIHLIAAGHAVLSWPVSLTGFTLEACTDLGSGVWTPVSHSVVDTPTEHTVSVSTVGLRCYRLKQEMP